jgi:UrcA family protein
MNFIAQDRRHLFVRTLLLGVAAGLSLGAQAGETSPAPRVSHSVVVSYADLDLTGPDGARKLYARLRAAAREVCGPVPSVREHRETADYQACHERALSKVVNRIGSEQLYAVHAQRSRAASAG